MNSMISMVVMSHWVSLVCVCIPFRSAGAPGERLNSETEQRIYVPDNSSSPYAYDKTPVAPVPLSSPSADASSRR